MTDISSKTCPVCGETVKTSLPECPNCGAALEIAPFKPPKKPRKTDRGYARQAQANNPPSAMEFAPSADEIEPDAPKPMIAPSVEIHPPIDAAAPQNAISWAAQIPIFVAMVLFVALLVMIGFFIRATSQVKSQTAAIAHYHAELSYAQATLETQSTSISHYSSDLQDSNATLEAQANIIHDNTVYIQQLNETIGGLQADVRSLQNRLSDADQQIAALQANQPAPVTIYNHYTTSQYVAFDSMFVYVPYKGSATVYLKPGSYSVKACHPTDMSGWTNCAKWGSYTITASGYTFTINK